MDVTEKYFSKSVDKQKRMWYNDNSGNPNGITQKKGTISDEEKNENQMGKR